MLKPNNRLFIIKTRYKKRAPLEYYEDIKERELFYSKKNDNYLPIGLTNKIYKRKIPIYNEK